MLLEKEYQKLIHDLLTHERGQIFLSGSDISVTVFDHSSKMSLATPVYFGSDYIPKSVRSGVSKSPPFEKNQSIRTYLTIDEENHRIFLHYLGTIETLNSAKFTNLLDDFSYLAGEWRIYLDEHDKNDLIHVRVK